MQEGIQLRVSDFIYALKKRFKLIIIMFVLGIIAGIILSGVSYLHGTMTKSYRITSTAVFLTQNTAGSFSTSNNATYTDLQMATDMVETVKFVMKSEKMMNTVIDKTGLVGINPSSISTNLDITQQADTPVMTLSLTWRNDEEGIKILSAIIDSSASVLKDTITTGRLSVIDEPSARYIVGGSMSIPVWGVAATLGLLLGVGYAVLEVLLKPTLINISDTEPELGLELLGTVRKDVNYFSEDTILPVRNITTESNIIQDYSAISHILKNRLDKRRKNHIIYVTSTISEEGRTSVTANIAMQLAEMGHRVLLVDYDTVNPSVGSLLLGEVNYEQSLNALYRGDINETEAVVKVNGHLDVLPSILEYKKIPMDSSIFDTLRKLSQRYEYIIIDTPPIGEFSETLSLNELAEVVLMVVGFDMTIKTNIQTSIEKLDKSGIRILGCVVNKVTSGSIKEAVSDIKNITKMPNAKIKKMRIIKPATGKGHAIEEDDQDIEIKELTVKASKMRKNKNENKQHVTEELKLSDKTEPKRISRKRTSYELLNEISEENEPLSDEETIEALIEMELNSKS